MWPAYFGRYRRAVDALLAARAIRSRRVLATRIKVELLESSRESDSSSMYDYWPRTHQLVARVLASMAVVLDRHIPPSVAAVVQMHVISEGHRPKVELVSIQWSDSSWIDLPRPIVGIRIGDELAVGSKCKENSFVAHEA